MTPSTAVAPFVGLRHYEVDEADLFAGRGRETMRLLAALLGSRLLIVSGPCGVGKSSLVRAGGLAGLGSDAVCLPVGRAVPHSTFRTHAPTDHNIFAFTLLSTWAPDRPARALRRMSVAQFLTSIDAVENAYGDELPLVAVIDQFEEVFGDVPAWVGQRDDFLRQLAEALAAVERLHLVLVIDETMLGAILRHEAALSPDYRAHYNVMPLGRAAAIQALTRPFAARGQTFEAGVAEALVDQLTIRSYTDDHGTSTTVTDDVDPAALQLLGADLWRSLEPGPALITQEHVVPSESLDASLAQLCADAVAAVAAIEDIPEAQLWKWLGDMFITELGTRGTAYEGLTTTAGLPHSVAWALERRSILRSEKRLGAVWFELQHDLLIDPIRQGRDQASDAETAAVGQEASGVLLRMAESALAYGQFSLADEYATRALATEVQGLPVQAEAEALLGKVTAQQALDATGERANELYESARRHYERAMELFQERNDSPAVGQVLVALGQLQRLRGHDPEALVLLRSALQRHRGDPTLYLELARLAEGSHDLPAAIRYYSSVLELAPENTEALVERGAVYARLGNASAALADLDNAVRRQPHLGARDDVIDARRRAAAVARAAV